MVETMKAMRAKYPNEYIAIDKFNLIKEMFPDLFVRLDGEEIEIKDYKLNYLMEVLEKIRGKSLENLYRRNL